MARTWTVDDIVTILRAGHVCTSRNDVWNRLIEYEVGREGRSFVVRWAEIVAGETARHGVIWSGADVEFASTTFLQHAGPEIAVVHREPLGAVGAAFPSLAIRPPGEPVLNGGGHR